MYDNHLVAVNIRNVAYSRFLGVQNFFHEVSFYIIFLLHIRWWRQLGVLFQSYSISLLHTFISLVLALVFCVMCKPWPAAEARECDAFDRILVLGVHRNVPQVIPLCCHSVHQPWFSITDLGGECGRRRNTSVPLTFSLTSNMYQASASDV